MSEEKRIDTGIVGPSAHTLRTGLPCENCGEIIEDRFCGLCGQLAADFHRPLIGLLAASLSDAFALDGRLARTLREMVLKPGLMTRNYLDGQRNRYVPPFRLYIFASLIFFFAIFTLPSEVDLSAGGGQAGAETESASATSTDETGEDQAPTEYTIEEMMDDEGRLDAAAITEALTQGTEVGDLDEKSRAEVDRFVATAANVYNNQDRFLALLKAYAPRASVVMVPLLAGMLALLYLNKRSVFLVDHLVTALHFQVFVYFSMTVVILLGMVTSSLGWIAGFFLLPFLFYYLYRQQRRVYAGARSLTLLRTGVLSVALFALLMIIVLGLVYLAAIKT
ncbi:MAG: DUF3667 domain-containing protein [Hyphomonas sp.]